MLNPDSYKIFYRKWNMGGYVLSALYVDLYDICTFYNYLSKL